MIYITGDKHGDYSDIEEFCIRFKTTKNDVMIVLGDNGVNYYGVKKDRRIKKRLEDLPITFIMIRGNHDKRPQDIDSYHIKFISEDSFCGQFYVQDQFPSLLFTKEFGAYRLGGKTAFVIGGAYSVDKYYRLEMYDQGHHQYHWFYNEQLSQAEKDECYAMMKKARRFDIIMSHTCPLRYTPIDRFINIIDESQVDNSMQVWLDIVESDIEYDEWFCGHWHTDRIVDKMRFMFNDVMALE